VTKLVRLQKRFAYRYKAKDGERIHYKHVVTIPEDAIEKLGWKEGQELEPKIKNDVLEIRRAEKDAKRK
jgi:bifunctional DNA-binding transcriptional regulator/antitoxin component of YhaV-PrlF toxin-antitoxin module